MKKNSIMEYNMEYFDYIKRKTLENQGFKSFKSGPTWARTKDPLIMSQML